MESTAWRGTGRPQARDPRKVSVPPGSSEEAGRASLSGVHRAHLPDAAAWPGLAPERRGSQASMALFFLPRGLTAHGVSTTLSPPTSLWARTAHLPVSPGQLSGQPPTVTSKRAGRVTPRQPGPGSTRPSPRLSLSYLYGLRLRLAALHAAPRLLRPSAGSRHSPQAHRPHTPPGPGCPMQHHLSSRRRPTRALSAPRVVGTTSH